MRRTAIHVTKATVARRVGALTMLAAALAAGLVPGGSAGVSSPNAAAPTLYFMYAMNCTFTIVDDAGKPVTSVAPGSYQVDVRTPVAFGTLPLPDGGTDMTACQGVPQFQLTGPGVSLFTTMTAGCEADKVFVETFKASSTYVAVDLNQPAVARGSFTTLASGTPTAPSVSYGGGKAKAEQSQDIVGSLAIRGTLRAAVGAKGSLALTSSGKGVSKLKPGRYKFVIDDQDAKAGFVLLGPTSTAPRPLSGVSFRGKRWVSVKLTPGRWTYYTSLRNVRYLRVA